VGDYPLFVLAVAAIGAVIPFLLHNAFGIESKMFVGDGGSLQMGVVLSVFVMEAICKPEYTAIAEAQNLALVPFVLATLSIPVFDTLRVMIARIARGISPLIGDKTHLHHLFIGLGISHIGTAVLITLLNFCVVLIWHAAARGGCSADVQLYVVIGAALLLDWGIYYLVALLDKTIPQRMNRLREWKINHRPNRRLFDFMRKIVDKM
ncbi:MAG: undecaprenyl/decaprenyl-phosphate alpha-N-acetylglucosaminyl 1-phosphate transferase, partial [Alistipes sp.]|nr:undecaprenyl/decaprenyl-phosphate alpha-N-acetylglucosaminyl 1-phosphate transferase [Alistipes sp.]